MSESENQPATDDTWDPKPQGVLRRNAPLIVGLVAVMVIGPTVSRVLKQWRGVVLQHRQGETLVGFEERAPTWVPQVEALEGTIVEKTLGDWTASVSETTTYDRPLIQLHERFSRQYEGEIVRIIKPRTSGGHHTAVVKLSDGTTTHVKILSDHLAGSEVGRWMRKDPGSWDPVLIDAPSGVARLAPPPGKGEPEPPAPEPNSKAEPQAPTSTVTEGTQAKPN